MSASFETAPLRDLTERTQLWNPDRGERNRIRYIDVSSVSRQDLSIHQVLEREAATAPSRARKVVRAHDTVFATIRPGLRRIAQVPIALDDAIVSTAFCVLRPRLQRIDPDYMFFAVTSDSFVRAVEALESGASYPAVRDSDVLDQAIPLPPLPEQRQIAAILAAVRKSLRRNTNSLSHASELKHAAMRALFTRGLRGEVQKETEIGTSPESWRLELLGSHFSVGSGGTPRRGVSDYWNAGSIPWVKTTEIDYGIIGTTAEHITRLGLEDSAARIYPLGTLLMAMYGQGVTRGRVARLGIEAACNQACAAMNPSDASIDTAYLFYFLTFRYEDMRHLAHGGQQQNLNMDIVRALPVSYPPAMDEQCEIVAILDAIDKKIDLHKHKRAVLEDLFKSLLHKLMTGEIRVSDLDLTALQPPMADRASA
jgi:type I restriction enzyme S subunit